MDPRYITLFRCSGCGGESARSSVGDPGVPALPPCPECGGDRRALHTTLDRRSRFSQPRQGLPDRRTVVTV